MEQYIPKSALVEEINKLQDAIKATAIDGRISKEQAEAYKVCVKLRNFAEDTLGVKEADLEKEIEKYAYSLPHSVTGTTSFVSDIKSPIARAFGIKHDWSYKYVEQIAVHFYELGLKAQKGE